MFSFPIMQYYMMELSLNATLESNQQVSHLRNLEATLGNLHNLLPGYIAILRFKILCHLE